MLEYSLKFNCSSSSMTVNTSKAKSVQHYLMPLPYVRLNPLSPQLFLEQLESNCKGQPVQNNRSHQIVIDKASLNISVIHFNFRIFFGLLCISSQTSFRFLYFSVLIIHSFIYYYSLLNSSLCLSQLVFLTHYLPTFL